MRLALIGMSGAGKSYWSAMLGRHGFEIWGCDDAIGRRLAAAGEIAAPSLEYVGRWMGFPYEPEFARREARYLELEAAVMDELLSALETAPPVPGTAPLVIDTTGSVIYTGAAILQRLRRQTVVIYLALPPARREVLRRAYEADPRPIVWRRHFRKDPAETDRDAVKRCFHDLLAERERRYRRCAHLEFQWDPMSRTLPEPNQLLGPAAAFLERRGGIHVH